ncbi:hypothetical protein [Bdellovibrio sp.]
MNELRRIDKRKNRASSEAVYLCELKFEEVQEKMAKLQRLLTSTTRPVL